MPNLSLFRSHPLADVNPVVIRAWAVLPALPNWIFHEFNTAGWEWALFYFAYQRAGATGGFNVQGYASPYSSDQVGVENWFSQSLHVDGVLVAGQIAQGRIQQEYDTYQSQWGGVETFVYGPTHIAKCAERMRFRVTESVNTVPGSLQILAYYSVG